MHPPNQKLNNDLSLLVHDAAQAVCSSYYMTITFNGDLERS